MHDSDPFLRHIVLLLSVYEIGTKVAPPLIWHGPETWQTISITRAIKALRERLWMAEKAMRSLQRRLANSLPSKSSRNKTWKLMTNSTMKQPSATISPSSSSSSTPTPRLTKMVPNSKLDKNSPSASAGPVTNSGSSGSTIRPSLSLGTLPPTLNSNHYTNLQPNHTQALASNGSSSRLTSAPPISHAFCPTCSKTISDPMVLPPYAGYDSSGINSSGSSPMIVPSMGPLTHAAFESGILAMEELKLLKAQVQDVACVCNTVAKGDLSQKIIVPVQGVLYFCLPHLLRALTAEVTRVTLEVRAQGKLGSQAYVPDVKGVWFELVRNVHSLPLAILLS
ncbi:Hybrid signal transduction histidine kinase J [Leucoagaricus sp. SymC.cos]|nr:Hybrid signal transduction histidine kinase J [Leucoagaricus sp. SymC.cos]